jgi:hypothetical protein
VTQLYQLKFKELFIEFTRYITEHPEFASLIPPNAQVVLLDSRDPAYSLQAMKFVGQAQMADDVPHRPVIYIEVREMAPLQSRLRQVEILKTPPEYALAGHPA